MDPLIGGAIASGASQLIGSLSNIGANKRALKYSKKMADYQFDLNKKMWDMQNEYNSPSAQMARYQEAGLNPNLIYGEGTVASSGNSPSAPTAEQPSYQQPYLGLDKIGPGLSRAFQDLLSIFTYRKDLAKSNSEIFRNNAEGASSLAKQSAYLNEAVERGKNASWIESRKVAQDIQNKYQDNLLQQQLNIGRQQLNSLLEDISLKQQQFTTELYKQSNIHSDTQKKLAETAYSWARKFTENALRTLYVKQGRLTDSQVETARKLAEFYSQQATTEITKRGNIKSERQLRDYLRKVNLPTKLKLEAQRNGIEVANTFIRGIDAIVPL